MSGFHVVYRQGSFALSDRRETREQALAHALALMTANGVWHVQVEDASGKPVVHSIELEFQRRAA
jgi:hypothetical protein